MKISLTLLFFYTTTFLCLNAQTPKVRPALYLRSGLSTLHSFQNARFSWEGGGALAFKPTTTWSFHTSFGYALRGFRERLSDDNNSYEGFRGIRTQRNHYLNLDLTAAYHLSDFVSIHLGPYFAYQLTALQDLRISYLQNGIRQEEAISSIVSGIYHPEDFGALLQVRALPIDVLTIELTLRQGFRNLLAPNLPIDPYHTQAITLGVHFSPF